MNILGPLCMNIDVIRTGVRLPALKKGDILLIRNVGAYNIPQSMQFIFERPAAILIHGAEIDYLRVRETDDHIRALDRLPDHLRAPDRPPAPPGAVEKTPVRPAGQDTAQEESKS